MSKIQNQFNRRIVSDVCRAQIIAGKSLSDDFNYTFGFTGQTFDRIFAVILWSFINHLLEYQVGIGSID